jgi:hypothetical protein
VKDKEKIRTPRFLAYFAIWFAFALVGFVIGMIATDWREYYELSERGIKAEGRVVAKEPENHKFIRYSYEAGEQTYSGIGSAGRGNHSFEDLNIGDPLVVFYDSDAPSISCLGYPSSHLRDSTAGIMFLVLLLPLFGIYGLYRKGYLKSKRARLTSACSGPE